jgi:hypothetical protein
LCPYTAIRSSLIFLSNGCGTDRHGRFRDKLLEGFYLRQWNNPEWLPPHKITPDLRLVTGADEIDHLSLYPRRGRHPPLLGGA